jgi:hypothetical protein
VAHKPGSGVKGPHLNRYLISYLIIQSRIFHGSSMFRYHLVTARYLVPCAGRYRDRHLLHIAKVLSRHLMAHGGWKLAP